MRDVACETWLDTGQGRIPRGVEEDVAVSMGEERWSQTGQSMVHRAMGAEVSVKYYTVLTARLSRLCYLTYVHEAEHHVQRLYGYRQTSGPG